ncbi:hypothetical protein IC582_014839 [Cucumis melo]
MEYFNLEASRIASSLFLVAWINLCEISPKAIFQCSSLAAKSVPSLIGLGLFLVNDETIDFSIPLGLAIEKNCLATPLLSKGTTENFSRACGRHLLQDTDPVLTEAAESGCFLVERLGRTPSLP